ncbi:MAG: methionyl-tRNA formyltransferase [Rhodospirillaceae bacterium]|nr:MAG: methionyl-tRNA formyltransferase [Rhodospirillaceae bacterium]
MKLIFMGTPDFSVLALKSILDAGHHVVCVYSQPPRKSGRGQKLTPTAVHNFAASKGLEVRTPVSLKDSAEQQAFADLNADIAVVVAYGLILPIEVLEAPRLGCVNIHASLLPRWRGAAPIQRCIEAGDDITGVTTMQMDAGLDTGPMLLTERLPITYDMNAETLHDALADIGGRLIVATLAGLAADKIQADPQPTTGMTYAKKIDKAETRINWDKPANDVANHIRGLYPMAWFEWNGQRIRVLDIEVTTDTGPHGYAVDDNLTIACKTGAVRLTQLQPAGKNSMNARAYMNGRPTPKGSELI